MAAENISFNVLEHDLVPEHYLLSEEEVLEVLSKLEVTRDQLPKIRKSDAAIKVLENIYSHPIEEGCVVKVVRKSATAEEFVAYRLVTRG
ncbi:MAG: DNA-directed RNA polymerase subunit H [Candidatus Methanomethylophilaceae archaeon]|nr:DNA-directed RNA polymerase subunit H [Thermoplasmata archaeon]MBQ2763163.1 DNA-directed RNA polymerase subunit H [Candidatus Methanomethylophilaceae archaeon]